MAATADALKTAEDAINQNGFVDEKEVPDLKTVDYARELAGELTKSREKKSEKGYIYTEPFDFEGGKIENVIWNMDEIKTRNDAKEALANDMGLTIHKDTLSAADEVKF